VALGVGGKAIAGGGERRLLANAGEHILQGTALGHVVVHVVAGEERDAGASGGAREKSQAAVVAAVVGERGQQADATREGIAERGEGRIERGVSPLAGHDA
jgi:hypothetical protein